MKIERLMTRNVAHCRPHETLDRAAQIMWERDCGCVPVVDESLKVIGMLTDRDICMAALAQGKPLADIPVSRAMSETVYACKVDEELDTAEQLMESKQIRRVPVLDDKSQLQGILSLNDLALRADIDEQKAGGQKEVRYREVAHTLASVCRHAQS